MSNRMRMIRLMALLCPMAFGAGALAQNTLQPYKLALYEDAARISYKGVIAFQQQRADIPLDYHVDSDGLDLSSSANARILYYRVRVDSLSKRVSVASWPDVLRANIDKRVTVVYQIGQEFDDVDGDVRYVNEQSGLLLLHGTNNAEYFIPLDQIKQVVIENLSAYKFDKKVPVEVLEVGIDTDLPSIPMEMFSMNTSLSWSPVCRLRIVGSNKARLQLQGIVENQLGEFRDVELELNAGSLLNRSSSSEEAEPLPGGKLSLRKGDRLVLNLRDTELEYESNYRCQMPWKGIQADGRLRPFSVDNTLRLALPPNSGMHCQQYNVVDEHNRHVATITGGELAADGSISLNMGQADDIKISLVETQVKSDAKPIKIGETTYDKVSVEGKIVCQNFGQKFAQIQISREVVGEVTEPAKAQNTPSPTADSNGAARDYARLLTWKQSLDKGQKKEIAFKYDALVARP